MNTSRKKGGIWRREENNLKKKSKESTQTDNSPWKKNQQYKNCKVKKNKYHDFETNSSEIKQQQQTNKQTKTERHIEVKKVRENMQDIFFFLKDSVR